MADVKWRRRGAGVATVIYGVSLLVLTAITSTTRTQGAITWMIVLAGASLGWLGGVLASPYDPTEESRFAKYAGVVSLFVSGYLVGKVDSVLTEIMSPDRALTE